MKSPLLLISMLLVFILVSCENEENENDGGSSHNAGKNCLSCHSFSVAGTVYNAAFTSTYSSAVIEVTSGPEGTGTVLATLSSDLRGNFYTNSSVDFGSGVYVNVLGNNGPIKYMNAKITTGACNKCHTGNSTSRVWAE